MTRNQMMGVDEFWKCVQSVPAARAYECIPLLATPKGKETIEIDVTKTKLPVKFEIKPNWLWFALGFGICWILKR